jgi:hypothetical protein
MGSARVVIASGPAVSMAAAVFGGLASLRGRRSLHPDGASYRATLDIDAKAPGLPAGRHPVLLRFSRGIGLPRRTPDLLGLAIRIPDLHGPGRDQDLLMTTSLRPPILHHLLFPALRGPFGQPYSTILPYRVAGALAIFGVLPLRRPDRRQRADLDEFAAAADAGEARFALALARPGRPWHRIGLITAGEPLPAEEGERLSFNPWNAGGEIRPAGPFQRIRDPAYSASQRARLAA